MKVKNHTKYSLFNYDSEESKGFQLGDILYREYDHAQKNVDYHKPEIGIVIQTYSDGDCRTDMWGNCSLSETSLATMEQIKEYRPEILTDITK